jgi:hypothetical protein
VTTRRRPRPRSAPTSGAAAQTLGLRLVRVERPKLTLSRVMGQMLGGLVRQSDVAPFRVEVVELSTDRVLAVQPVNGTEGQAHEVMALMRNELGTMDDRTFLRRWRRRP